jgi:hypothetical protein
MRWRVTACLGLAILAAMPRGSYSMWAFPPTEPIPVERLIKNVTTYIAAHPDDAQGFYILGRIHSRAFAENTETLVASMTTRAGQPAELPTVTLPSATIMQPRMPGTPAPGEAARAHLAESIRNYRRATELAPQEALYFLGLGWMLEQAIPYGSLFGNSSIGKPSGQRSPQFPPENWRAQALAAYRRAYVLRIDADLKQEYFGPGADSDISREAGEGILRLLEGKAVSAEENAEIYRLRESVRKMTARGKSVTPIIFPLQNGPLRGPAPLEALLSPDKFVSFDLAGDGRPAKWPWVNADAGFLVWDPENRQQITSGRQLFGSATWWMFWRDGYQALAALDDDGNGWLEGNELQGIAIWRDANGNGVCDPGEIISLRDAGIVRIAVRAAGRVVGPTGGMPFNPQGIQLRDGTSLPTYDWTPTSVSRTAP